MGRNSIAQCCTGKVFEVATAFHIREGLLVFVIHMHIYSWLNTGGILQPIHWIRIRIIKHIYGLRTYTPTAQAFSQVWGSLSLAPVKIIWLVIEVSSLQRLSIYARWLYWNTSSSWLSTETVNLPGCYAKSILTRFAPASQKRSRCGS